MADIEKRRMKNRESIAAEKRVNSHFFSAPMAGED